MKKQLLIIGIIVLLVCVGLSGCTGEDKGSENNPKVINLGDSITHGTIRVTFLSATWVKPYDWSDSYYYDLEVKGENIGSAEDSVFVKITKYEMANGYTYSDDYIWQSFSLNPGRSGTLTIRSVGGGMAGQIIDRDFLPVAKIYVTLDENANPMLSAVNPIYAIINV